MTYRVVTDLKAITRLNRQLGKALRQTFRRAETRTISYPAGNVPGKVYFADGRGDRVPAWYSGTGIQRLSH